MSDIDNRIIVDKDEHMELLKNNYYLNGRIVELEKQVKILLDMLNQK